MPSKTLFLVLILATGCLWAQDEKKETPPPAGGTAIAAQAAPHPAAISAEDKARKNPVKFTEVSVDRGKKYTAPNALFAMELREMERVNWRPT